MKKALLVCLALAFPMVVQATAVCVGDDGGDKDVEKPTPTAGMFIVNGFTMKCSKNVFLNYEQNSTTVAVGAASKKGLNQFSGSSAGGQVKPTQTKCANTGCVATDASGPATAALSAASST